jgi:hypothetical protein
MNYVCDRISKVVDDYDAMLNQTNIGANNNKFYVVQALKKDAKFYTYARWGRVVSGRDETFEMRNDDLTG